MVTDSYFDFGDVLEMRCADNADADDLRRAAQLAGKTGLADRLENLAWALEQQASDPQLLSLDELAAFFRSHHGVIAHETREHVELRIHLPTLRRLMVTARRGVRA